VSIPNYRDWKSESQAFSEMVLWMPWSFNVSGNDQAPERLLGHRWAEDKHALKCSLTTGVNV